ncbi:HEAT repeat domain-containing protein [Actinoplanes sp. HUAS TT8]|uniref:HEAT repeat domain-containing protein n=1 Tax=Actinoplanes sp. HUAS TT8 TaxID=3447453 RepID=UPI003F5244CB
MTFADIREAAGGNLDLDYYDLVRELVASGDRSVVGPAREALERDVARRNGLGRDLMALVLAGLDAVESFPLLLDVYTEELRHDGVDDLDTLTRALGTAARAGRDSARATILARVTDPDQPVRRAALRVLEYVFEPSDLGVVRAGLADPDPWVRFAALGSLPTVADNPEVYQIVVAALHDPDGWVQREAVLLLAWSSPPSVVDHLIAMLGEVNFHVHARSAVGEAIGRMAKGSDRVPAAAAALRELLADTDSTVRAGAVRGIGLLGEPLDALPAVTGDPDQWVADAAAEVLRRSGSAPA